MAAHPSRGWSHPPPSHLLAEFRRLIRRLRSLGPEIGAVIVDHIGLVEVQAPSDNGRISMITGALKGFAMECKVPIIELSQLNRQVEARDEKRPRLSDLRDSGSIEQDPDNVLFCYRPEYYPERAESDDTDPNARIAWEIKLHSARGLLEIGVADATVPSGLSRSAVISQQAVSKPPVPNVLPTREQRTTREPMQLACCLPAK